MNIIQKQVGRRWVRLPVASNSGHLVTFRSKSEAREALLDIAETIADEHAHNQFVAALDLNQFRVANI